MRRRPWRWMIDKGVMARACMSRAEPWQADSPVRCVPLPPDGVHASPSSIQL